MQLYGLRHQGEVADIARTELVRRIAPIHGECSTTAVKGGLATLSTWLSSARAYLRHTSSCGGLRFFKRAYALQRDAPSVFYLPSKLLPRRTVEIRKMSHIAKRGAGTP